MNVVLLLAHEIEEYQQVLLMHELGHEVFSIGAYMRPSRPGATDMLRPPLPQVPEQPDLIAAVDALGQQGHEDTLMAAKCDLPGEVIEWADVIIVHHLEHTWLIPQWSRLRNKRVIWRTVGQSTHGNEWMMQPLRRDGLQIVRYSPKERNIPEYCGEDALIRFWMDPDEWSGWAGDDAIVTNVTQDLYRRSVEEGSDPPALKRVGHQWTNWQYWEQATSGLSRLPAGPGSQTIGGTGSLSLSNMQALLRSSRAYLYTGTQPASYTLGLLEALMTGIPVVSIGPAWMGIFPYSPDLFEGHELSPIWSDTPSVAKAELQRLLNDHDWAREVSAVQRRNAVATFGKATVMEQWRAFLGDSVVQPEPVGELVAA